MAAQNLTEFFREKRARAGRPGDIDWQKRKEEWLQAIEDLYRDITQRYLKRAIAGRLVHFAD